jgi:hypothetical protein
MIRRLESHEIRGQYSPQEGLPHAQTAEDLARRECDVEKKADDDVRACGEALTQELREQHEVVVVHKHDVAVLVRGGDGVGESCVDGDVLGPG